MCFINCAEAIEYAAGHPRHISRVHTRQVSYRKDFFQFSLQCLDEHIMYLQMQKISRKKVCRIKVAEFREIQAEGQI